MKTTAHENFSSTAAPAPGTEPTSDASSGHPGGGIDSSLSGVSASFHGPVLAFRPASDASQSGGGVLACPVSSSASVPGSGASAAASFSGSASAPEGGLLTPEQMALRLNVSRRCLGNWARDRIIPMVKIGRICRFDLPQVMAALEKHVQAAATR